MSQPRWQSVAESVANVAIGYGVALAAQIIVFPIVGVHADIGQNIIIGAAFTFVSIVRSYCVRRVFNRWSRA